MSTYQGGNNPDWFISLSTVDNNHPLEQVLRGSGNDNFGSFAKGDPKPKFRITFQGDCKYLLHYIEGRLTSRFTNGRATAKFLDETGTKIAEEVRFETYN